MPRGQKKAKSLLSEGNHQLLSLKELLDQVLAEAKDLPDKVQTTSASRHSFNMRAGGQDAWSLHGPEFGPMRPEHIIVQKLGVQCC